MLILGITVALILLFVGLAKFTQEDAWHVGTGVFCFALFAILFCWPINYWDTQSQVSRFKATGSTLTEARKQGNVMENAALQQKVIESNQWLAETQYFRTTIWRWWIPGNVDSLTPIK